MIPVKVRQLTISASDDVTGCTEEAELGPSVRLALLLFVQTDGR